MFEQQEHSGGSHMNYQMCVQALSTHYPSLLCKSGINCNVSRFMHMHQQTTTFCDSVLQSSIYLPIYIPYLICTKNTKYNSVYFGLPLKSTGLEYNIIQSYWYLFKLRVQLHNGDNPHESAVNSHLEYWVSPCKFTLADWIGVTRERRKMAISPS